MVCDQDEALIKQKINGSLHAESHVINALDPKERGSLIQQSDLVISMLPARFHPDIVRDCIQFRKNVITPSYVSEELEEMSNEIEEAGILVLNEMGVDPGIDHMSAMEIMDRIKAEGGKIIRFESFTGGLVAPESDNNPWNYKFTWNPRNVVLAGQGGTACFRQDGKYKYIPSHKLFSRVKPINIEGHGDFEGYANRDSLKYMQVYGLEDIQTIYRGTLRRSGFSEAWDVFVQLGLTDDSYNLSNSEEMSARDFVNSFLFYDTSKTVEVKLREYLTMSDEVFDKIEWLGMFGDEVLGLKGCYACPNASAHHGEEAESRSRR